MDYGGAAEVVAMLSLQQKKQGCDVTIATLERLSEELILSAITATAAGVKIVYFKPSFPKELYFSWQMLTGLRALVKDADVVHIHLNWTFPVWCGCTWALLYKKKLVMSPHGCVAPERLKISALKKKIVGWLYDRPYLMRASVIHATCEAEAEDVRTYLGSSIVLKCGSSRVENVTTVKTNELTNSRTNELPLVVVIPNGVDLESFDSIDADRAFVDLQWPACKGKRVALFLSRIHSIKGLEMLIQAWSEVQANNLSSVNKAPLSILNSQFSTAIGQISDDWILLIAGGGEEKYVRSLKQQVEDTGLSEKIKFIGSVFGDDKVKLMKAADLFVLPTKNENFGIVVAESLACGVPVITTKGAPWAELRGYDSSKILKCESSKVCADAGESAEVLNAEKYQNSQFTTHNSQSLSGRSGWWIDQGVEPLAEALKEAMALSDEERKAMGQNGRKLVEQKYQWSSIAEQMQDLYAALPHSKQA